MANAAGLVGQRAKGRFIYDVRRGICKKDASKAYLVFESIEGNAAK